MEIIREIGAFAGLAAFLGLAVMALLYFAQARDVRRLRENASFLLESPEEYPAAGEAGAADSKAPPPSDAEAFRRAELTRQAQERRARFEQRRRGFERGGAPVRAGGGGIETRSIVIIVVGVLLLAAGGAFAATRLISDDDGGAPTGQRQVPSEIRVAMLNSTAEPGLAGSAGEQLQQRGFTVRPITNTDSPFPNTVVMFEAGARAAAERVARELRPQVEKVEPMSAEIREPADGAQVAVVLGEDRI